ncbi:hypothetical protein MASR1M12_29430 [Erysipelotrichia bacterium]
MNESYNLLQKHFDTAFDTPDGIKKLRELILTLAMQGKLVPQNPKDQPASELLKEIAAEKSPPDQSRQTQTAKAFLPSTLKKLPPNPFQLAMGEAYRYCSIQRQAKCKTRRLVV